MSLHIYRDLEQRSEAWFAARCGLITASAVSKLVTPAHLKTASNDESRSLTLQLATERITGVTETSYMNSDMLRGVLHEPFAVAAYSEHHAPVRSCGFMVREEDGWSLGFSPDGLVGDDGLIEVKCPRAKGHISTILVDEVPSYYMAQLQAGLLVSGRDWIDYVSFHGGLPLYKKRVLPDPKWQDALIAAVQEFEKAAVELVSNYWAASTGLPTTEPVPDLDDIRVA